MHEITVTASQPLNEQVAEELLTEIKKGKLFKFKDFIYKTVNLN